MSFQPGFTISQRIKHLCLQLRGKNKKAGYLLSLLLFVSIALSLPGFDAQAATITVNTTADDDTVNGNCTLREAMIAARDNSTKDACGTGGAVDTITFNINASTDPGCNAGTGVCTIQPATELPTLYGSGHITIDGYTQPGAATATNLVDAEIRIEIDGSLISTGFPQGIHIQSPSNVIKGLGIHGFSEGIAIAGSSAENNIIQGCYLGTDTTGSSAIGNSSTGVWLSEVGTGNQVGGTLAEQRNILSGNGNNGGIYLSGSSTGVTISGNYIGTSADGLSALPNETGIVVRGSVYSCTIGGSAEGAGNLISGNTYDGITLNGSTADPHDITIEGNWIGVDATGETALPNGQNGVQILNGAHTNTIGPDNLISGNNQSAVLIWTASTYDNQVIGNLIGTDPAGTSAIPNMNSLAAVYIQGEASSNIIGGSTVSDRNVISGNNAAGVRISGAGTMSNTVAANFIGVDISGDVALPNADGVVVTNDASNSVIGGDADGEGNVIVGGGVPVKIESGAFNTIVSGNHIGTDVCGTSSLGGGTGVSISGGAYNNIIGGTTVLERNVITGNSGWGIRINGSGTDSNQVLGNYIGVDVTGTVALTNGNSGVRIENSAQSNTIGPNNIIAYHIFEGIYAYGADTDYNIFTQNSIHNNGNTNLALGAGANEDIAPPAITSVTSGPATISGTLSPVCTGCTIEVFTSKVSYPRAGRTYLGSTTTTGTGTWSMTPTGLAGPYLTATVTDPAKGTSEFSSAFFVELDYVFLPLVFR